MASKEERREEREEWNAKQLAAAKRNWSIFGYCVAPFLIVALGFFVFAAGEYNAVKYCIAWREDSPR